MDIDGDARRDQLREIREAQRAAEAALDRLRAAAERLGNARAWGTYDTWFGGGFFASMVKHDRIDQSTAMLRQVDTALETLRAELGDIGIEGVAGVEVSDLLRTLDVWFDNVFSDAMTQSAVKAAAARVDQVAETVVRIQADLARRRAALEAETSA